MVLIFLCENRDQIQDSLSGNIPRGQAMVCFGTRFWFISPASGEFQNERESQVYLPGMYGISIMQRRISQDLVYDRPTNVDQASQVSSMLMLSNSVSPSQVEILLMLSNSVSQYCSSRYCYVCCTS